MKFGEIKGKGGVLVTADMIEYIGDIVSDDKYANMFPIPAVKGEKQSRTFIKFALKVIPNMLREHTDAVCSLLSIVSGKPADDMNLADIVIGIKELAQDEVFLSFFNSAATKKEESPLTDTSEK